MEKRKDEIEQLAFDIFERMGEKKNVSPFLNLLGDKEMVLQYRSMSYLKCAVIKAIQIGNYRRAMIMLLYMDRILLNIESVEDEIKQKVSLYILGE